MTKANKKGMHGRFPVGTAEQPSERQGNLPDQPIVKSIQFGTISQGTARESDDEEYESEEEVLSPEREQQIAADQALAKKLQAEEESKQKGASLFVSEAGPSEPMKGEPEVITIESLKKRVKEGAEAAKAEKKSAHVIKAKGATDLKTEVAEEVQTVISKMKWTFE